MEEIVIKAQPREVLGKKVKVLRKEGKLPAVLFGKNMDSIPVTLNAREAGKILSNVSSSQLVVIDINGDQHNALVRERQRHPVRAELLHVDFQVVSMTEKLKTAVGIVLGGTAPAVSNYNGVIVTGLESLEVESLPRELPERIVVDISGLEEIGDAVYVRDVKLPPEVTILSDPDEMLALVTAPAQEEALEEVEEEEVEYGEGEEPEVVERGKKEEEQE